jgi:hypothetical protein
MTPEIKAAIQKAKTCAPARCDNEKVCFVLALEVERLHAKDFPDITTPEPSYEVTEPMWEAS